MPLYPELIKFGSSRAHFLCQIHIQCGGLMLSFCKPRAFRAACVASPGCRARGVSFYIWHWRTTTQGLARVVSLVPIQIPQGGEYLPIRSRHIVEAERRVAYSGVDSDCASAVTARIVIHQHLPRTHIALGTSIYAVIERLHLDVHEISWKCPQQKKTRGKLSTCIRASHSLT